MLLAKAVGQKFGKRQHSERFAIREDDLKILFAKLCHHLSANAARREKTIGGALEFCAYHSDPHKFSVPCRKCRTESNALGTKRWAEGSTFHIRAEKDLAGLGQQCRTDGDA